MGNAPEDFDLFNVVALKDGIGRHVDRGSEVLGALCVLRASASKSV